MVGVEKINRFLMYLNDWALATAPNEWDDPEDKARRKAEYETIFECMRVTEKMLLKDAEPKEPIGLNTATNKGAYYIAWECPACGDIHMTVKGAYHFCPKCGQELLWTEERRIRRFRCIKEYVFQTCDDDGFTVDGKYGTVQPGSIWQESENMICGGSDSVHLDREDSQPNHWEWCEPLRETLEEYFEEIQEGK